MKPLFSQSYFLIDRQWRLLSAQLKVQSWAGSHCVTLVTERWQKGHQLSAVLQCSSAPAHQRKAGVASICLAYFLFRSLFCLGLGTWPSEKFQPRHERRTFSALCGDLGILQEKHPFVSRILESFIFQRAENYFFCFHCLVLNCSNHFEAKHCHKRCVSLFMLETWNLQDASNTL